MLGANPTPVRYRIWKINARRCIWARVIAAFKNEHFVPKVYLRSFASGGGAGAINLLNIDSLKWVQNAPIKGQCSKNYFYGRDPQLEERLQRFEGAYGGAIKKVLDDIPLSEDDADFLRNFAYLQSRRTAAFASQLQRMSIEMEDAIFEGRNNFKRP